MDQTPYQLPGAVATYSAKSALFTAGLADRGTFFDNTGSYTISFDAAATLGAGWSCWIRNVSGTQTLDPNGTELINGATTYAVSNAGDVILVECTGTAFVISQSQRPSTVAIAGGSINGTTIGAVSAATGAFTTLACSGIFTSTDTTDASAIGTASTVLPGGLSVAKALRVGAQITANGRFNTAITDANTVTATTVHLFDHASSGTPAAGFGSQILVRCSSDTTASQNVGLTIYEWTNATDATRKARVSHWAYDAASGRECLRIEASGSAAMIGFLGASAAIRYATTGTSTGFTAGAGSAVTHLSTFTGNSGSTAYTIADIVLCLKTCGLMTV